MMMVVVVVLGHQQKMPHNLVGCEIKARHVSPPTLYGRIAIKQWANRPIQWVRVVVASVLFNDVPRKTYLDYIDDNNLGLYLLRITIEMCYLKVEKFVWLDDDQNRTANI